MSFCGRNRGMGFLGSVVGSIGLIIMGFGEISNRYY